MAENLSRFVIIDGVQIEKARAQRQGLIDDDGNLVKRKGKVSPTADADASPAPEVAAELADDDEPTVETPSVEGPTGRRARPSGSARRG